MSGSVVVWNREQACSLSGEGGSVMISISRPGDPAPLMSNWSDARVLRVEFDDVDDKLHGQVVALSSGRRALQACQPEQARVILDFAAKHRDQTIHVHCDAGVSRSVAVGVVLADWLGKPLALKACHSPGLANAWVMSVMRRLTVYEGY